MGWAKGAWPAGLAAFLVAPLSLVRHRTSPGSFKPSLLLPLLLGGLVPGVDACLDHCDGGLRSFALRTFALAVLPAWLPAVAADQAPGDPCERPCGRAHTCGGLNVSFVCNVLSSGMGCDCVSPH